MNPTPISDGLLGQYDSPDELIYDQFADRREIVKKVAELELDELSEDAERILEILDQYEDTIGEGAGRSDNR